MNQPILNSKISNSHTVPVSLFTQIGNRVKRWASLQKCWNSLRMLMYQDDSQADLYTTHMLTGTHKDPHTHRPTHHPVEK